MSLKITEVSGKNIVKNTYIDENTNILIIFSIYVEFSMDLTYKSP